MDSQPTPPMRFYKRKALTIYGSASSYLGSLYRCLDPEGEEVELFCRATGERLTMTQGFFKADYEPFTTELIKEPGEQPKWYWFFREPKECGGTDGTL